MKKEEVKKLVDKLSKNFKRKEINIIFSGAIDFTIKMKNIKFFVTKDIIIIVNEDEKEFRVDPYYINNIEYKNKTIKLEMERLLYSTNRYLREVEKIEDFRNRIKRKSKNF